MACNYYYNSNSTPPEDFQLVDKNWVAYYGGIDPDTSTPAELAAAGFYCYIETTPPTFDPKLYTLTASWVITGTDASQDYTVVELPLATAKENCVSYEQGLATAETAGIAAASGYTGDVLTATASLPELSRPSEIQAVFDAQSAVVTELMATITAINAATTIDELNDIVNPLPITGSVEVNRTGNNLDASAVLSLTGCDPEQLSLYFNSTAISVPYSTGSSDFPATSSVFSGGDFTGSVKYLGLYEIATFDAASGDITVPINWTP